MRTCPDVRPKSLAHHIVTVPKLLTSSEQSFSGVRRVCTPNSIDPLFNRFGADLCTRGVVVSVKKDVFRDLTACADSLNEVERPGPALSFLSRLASSNSSPLTGMPILEMQAPHASEYTVVEGKAT